jgi:hypothetical protein
LVRLLRFGDVEITGPNLQCAKFRVAGFAVAGFAVAVFAVAGFAMAVAVFAVIVRAPRDTTTNSI